MPNDFDYLGSFADFLAEEETVPGAAIQVTDATMEPVLYKDDIVKVQKRDAEEGEVVCLRIDREYFFGYRVGDILERENGPDLPLTGTEHMMGVAISVIDREVRPRR